MKKKNVLYEIMHTQFYMIEPVALHQFRHEITGNILSRVVLQEDEDRSDGRMLRFNPSSGVIRSMNYLANGPLSMEWKAEEMEEGDKLINIIDVTGPITRGGGACSYGSKDIRDWMIQASAIDNVVANILYIDSNGGCVGCEDDLRDGLAAVRAAGQKVIAIVDGKAASMAYYFASLCDEIWAVNPRHEVGCIGCLISYYDIADGAENAITHEKYVEMYATQSTEKNGEFRAVSQGDREAMQERLDRHCQEFMDSVKATRPGVSDDQLKGKMYPAGEVLGSMVDRIGTLDELVAELFGISEPAAQEKNEEPAPEPEVPAVDPEKKPSETKNDKTMTEQYTRLAQIAGVQAFEQDGEGNICFVPSMALAAEAALEKAEGESASLLLAHKQTIANLEAEKNALQERIAELEASAASASEAHGAEMEEIRSGAEAKAAELEGQLQEMTAKAEEAEEHARQLEAEIEEMSHQTSQEPLPAAPADNNSSEKAKDFCPFDPNASQEEQRRQMAAWRASLKRH